MPLITRREACLSLAAAGTVIAVTGPRKSAAETGFADLAAFRKLSPPPVATEAAWDLFPPEGKPRPQSLASLRGRIAVLNIWATWCPPCVREMPSLARFAQAATDIAVLPVSIDRTPEPVRAFLAGGGNAGLPVLMDSGGATRSALGVNAVPVSFLVDASGVVRFRLDAPLDWAAPGIADRIRAMLRA